MDYQFDNSFYGEFDPGSGLTLAACLTHASRAAASFTLNSGSFWLKEKIYSRILCKMSASGGRLSNAWERTPK